MQCEVESIVLNYDMSVIVGEFYLYIVRSSNLKLRRQLTKVTTIMYIIVKLI